MRKDILNAITEIKEVKNLVNKSELARRFNCSINTVNKYLNIQEASTNARKYTSKLDNFKGIVIEKVDDYSANGRAIYNFIKEKGFTGSYGIVSKFIKKHKQEKQNKATMRFETTPGFQAQVDWKENFKIINEEQKYLNSLPPIDCINQYFRQNRGYKVSKESMVTYKKHKYSVPIKYIGEYLTVVENEDTLDIYYTTDLIVTHKISRQIFKLQRRAC